MKRRNNKALVFLVALLIITASVCAIIAKHNFTASSEPPKQEVSSGADVEAVPVDILMFASDYQSENGWPDPSETLKGIMGQLKRADKDPTNLIYCGDYTNDRNLHDYQLSPDDSIEEIRGIAASEFSGISQDDMIFVQGNHDALTDSITPTGLYEYDNYLVYVLNTQYDFPWKQGRDPAFRDYVIKASEEMKKCLDGLIAAGETRPVFIAGHVPVHFTARASSRHSTGDNMYASYIFDVVNEAADSLDIVYLFGHDHSKGWDCYIGGSSVFMKPGDTVLIPEAGSNTVNTDSYKAETLKFTYMNAGYTGYYMNCGPDEVDNGTADQYKAADETLTASICEIMEDEMIITRYSVDGMHPAGWQGEADPYKSGIDQGLIPSDFYSKMTDSPVHIPRKHSGK